MTTWGFIKPIPKMPTPLLKPKIGESRVITSPKEGGCNLGVSLESFISFPKKPMYKCVSKRGLKVSQGAFWKGKRHQWICWI